MAINFLKKILNETTSNPQEIAEHTVDRIQVATCIVLLEVAHSDDEFSSMEEATVTSILQNTFDLSEEAVSELIEVARDDRESSVDLWEFTDIINRTYSREEKIKVVEAAWRVVYADEKLDKYEDHFIHKLAKLLRLEHDDLISAKLSVLNIS